MEDIEKELEEKSIEREVEIKEVVEPAPDNPSVAGSNGTAEPEAQTNLVEPPPPKKTKPPSTELPTRPPTPTP